MTVNPYIEAESPTRTLKRAFENIAGALDLWSRTDVKRIHRVEELNRAQEIVLILLASIRGSDDDPFNQAMVRILTRTASDITDALVTAQPTSVSFREHVESFRWMAKAMDG